ncbi:MAG: flagellar hook-basal body complex protein FliE [Rhodobacteraceae bacterium HLUCCA12]|nr:MAG: flagellar hook-basal body complex protein FliE [Rhodobacteraceae bacterium HLUCCA12]
MELTATLAARSYGAARPMTAPDPTAGQARQGNTDFGRLAGDFADVLVQAETAARDTMMGNADPHAMVSALSEARMAVETTVAVRDKVVEAYLEILRMPV